MITLHIQPLSKIEMPFEEAVDYIQDHFPDFLTSTGGGYSPREGLIHLDFKQDVLTDEQRDWLHLSTFSADYIDSYAVEKTPGENTVFHESIESIVQFKKEEEETDE